MERPSSSRWAVELPVHEAADSAFGNCRGIENSYKKLSQIGEGTYGEVFLADDLKTHEKVALKKIRMDNEKEGFPITAIREIKLLKRLDNENVITLKEIVRSQVHKINNMKGSIYMVFDYMDHDLTGLMERLNHKMEVPHIKCYMKQLLKGLNFCHGKNILHRDLKASNLLLNNKGNLKIADFGLARTKDETTTGRLTNRVITLWYRPPELLLGACDYGSEIDMWSVGCVFAELLLGQGGLFPGKDETDQLDKICRIMGTPTEKTMPGVSKLQNAHMMRPEYKENKLVHHLNSKKVKDPLAIDLLKKLLDLNPKKRISAAAAATHDYFYAHPKPAEPRDMPRHEASHELDLKNLRQDKGRKGGAARPAPGPLGPDAKRPRTQEPPRPHDAYRQPPGQHPYDQRQQTHAQRPESGQRRESWDQGQGYDRYQEPPRYPAGQQGGYGGGYGQHSLPTRRHMPPLPAGGGGAYYPPAALPPMQRPPLPVTSLDPTGYPTARPAVPQTQAYRDHPPVPQQELGLQPSWANKRR